MQTSQPTNHVHRPASSRTFLGHPAGLFLLFLVEMWERFSYYGMRGLLVLYLITIFAAKELPNGIYVNNLEVVEMRQVDGKEQKASQGRQFILAVGQGNFARIPEAPKVTGQPLLKITRMQQVQDPKDAEKKIWEPLPADVGDPVSISGPKGGPFDTQKVAFRITNPTDKPVKCSIAIAREKADSRTLFTVNDNAGIISSEIKPDKDLKPSDKPFEVVAALNTYQSGRNWVESGAMTLYGWYTGLAYLLPIFGGMIADRLIGTHRSMLIGAILISMGHVILGLSGIGELANNAAGMSLFMMGLAVIILGTGYFKPTVSVMVGQLYPAGDPRRDGAFTIFYMGINLGAFICAFICGTLGEKVGWHYGFGSAAVGMLLGLCLYIIGRPFYLTGIGDSPNPGASRTAAMLLFGSLAIAVLIALAYHAGATRLITGLLGYLKARPAFGWLVVLTLVGIIFAWMVWFISINERDDRGPVITIFVYILFNAFFWLPFEQAGSTINVFTDENTARAIRLPFWLKTFCTSGGWRVWLICGLGFIVGVAATAAFIMAIIRFDRQRRYKAATASILGVMVAISLAAVGILTPLGYMKWVANFNAIPTTWFQSINAGLIFIFAPIFAGIWTGLGQRNMNPSQPVKIGLGLILLGVGFIFMVWAGQRAIGGAAKASMFLIFMTYFWHTLGELCLSPTGLSYVTKAAPVKFVSLLMGLYFVSSFSANLGGGLIAAQAKPIEQGKISLPWHFGGQADFFFIFVVSSIGAGLVILAFTPLLKQLQRGRE
ncbi:MAG: peptide MFS transporter [Tepidisphaerales bacterium]